MATAAKNRRSKKETLPPPLKTFDFETIRPHIEGLMFNLERDLKKRMNASSSRDTARGFLMMRVGALFMKQLFDAIRFLCADADSPGRRPEYVVAVPSITRTLLEILLTVMYVGEDFPNRSEAFHKCGWREHYEERLKYRNEYAKSPEWKPFFRNFEKSLQMGINELGITAEEAKDPKKIKYVPIGQRLIDAMGSPNRAFANWLEKWFYRECSAIAHFTPTSLMRLSMFFMLDVVPQELRDETSEAQSLARFKTLYYMMATILVTAIASEMEDMFNLGNRDQIVQIWQKMRVIIPDAQEVCQRRYDAVLNMKGPIVQ
jgi:hypothetical protein